MLNKYIGCNIMGQIQSNQYIAEQEEKERRYLLEIEHLKSLKNNFKNELEKQKQDANKLANQNAQLIKKNNDIGIQLDDCNFSFQEVEKMKIKLQEENTNLKEEIYNMKVENELESKENINEKINELEEMKLELENKINIFEDRKNNLESKISDLEDLIYSLENEKDNLLEKNNNLSDKNKKLIEGQKILTEQYQEMNKLYIEEKNDNDNLRDEIYNINQKFAKINMKKKEYFNSHGFKENIITKVMDESWIPDALEEQLCIQIFDEILDSFNKIINKKED